MLQNGEFLVIFRIFTSSLSCLCLITARSVPVAQIHQNFPVEQVAMDMDFVFVAIASPEVSGAS